MYLVYWCSFTWAHPIMLVFLFAKLLSLAVSLRLFGREEVNTESSVLAGMEGKTKEKLESMGLALLCLALRTDNPMHSYSMWQVVMLITP